MDIQKNISIEIMSKKSIRFFNDREVRAVWDDANNKWWFSATDIVRAINDEEDYKKCRNYWKYLKGKMTKDGIQLVSVTNHFKFQAPDGKQRAADALRNSGTLVTHFESEIDRLVYQLFGLTDEKPTIAVCYPRKTLINSLMPTTSM